MNIKKSFKKGWNQVPIGQQKEMRQSIMTIFNLKGRSSFAPKVAGRLGEPTYSQGLALEELFASKGITDIWD